MNGLQKNIRTSAGFRVARVEKETKGEILTSKQVASSHDPEVGQSTVEHRDIV